MDSGPIRLAGESTVATPKYTKWLIYLRPGSCCVRGPGRGMCKHFNGNISGTHARGNKGVAGVIRLCFFSAENSDCNIKKHFKKLKDDSCRNVRRQADSHIKYGRPFVLEGYLLFPCVCLSRQQESGCGHLGGSAHRPGSRTDRLHQEEKSTGPPLHQ